MSSRRKDKHYKDSKRGWSALAEIKNILNENMIKKRSTRAMVVEGSTDVELFSKLLSKYKKRVRIIPPFRTHKFKQNNKGGVIKIINICNSENWVLKSPGNNGIFGIIDADFMNINPGTKPNIDNLIITEFHDTDIEIFTSSYILKKFLIDAYPKKHFSKSQLLKLRRICLNLSSLYGKYLLLLERNGIYSNVRKELNFKIKQFLEFDDNHNPILKIDLIEENILNNNWNVNLDDLNNLNNINLKQLANGHDFFYIFWKFKISIKI